MPREFTEVRLELLYRRTAREYQRRLPPEHYMEPITQATQRKITLESLDLVSAERPDVHVFNELLVLYPVPRRKKPKGVVPDNMVVIHAGSIKAEGSYDVPLQPARPFLMLEYVSKSSERKDYEDNMLRYEQELQVPYYLLFHPDAQELTLYHHDYTRYVSVKPNERQRYEICDLELEVAILDGWVRYWFRGKLLPLPADMLQQLRSAEHRAENAEHRADNAEHRADNAEHRADNAEHRTQEAQQRAETAQHRAEMAEQESARLRAELEQFRRGSPNAP